MTSLWFRIAGGGSGKESLPDENEQPSKPSRRQMLYSVKPRKGVSSLFGTAKKGASPFNSDSKFTVDHVALYEAAHYPLYDPTNPEHNPDCRSSNEVPDPTKTPKRYSGSPGKISSFLERSRSRSRSPSPTTTRFGLQTIAGTIRATANLFYSNSSQRSACDPGFKDGPPSPVKSTASQKSVRFRSANSFIGADKDRSSPIPIPTQSSLPFLNIPISTSGLMGDELTDYGVTGCTARPPTNPVIIPAKASLAEPAAADSCLKSYFNDVTEKKNMVRSETSAPWIPQPTEDPFDDSAALSRRDERALRDYADNFRERRSVSKWRRACYDKEFVSNDEKVQDLDDTNSKQELDFGPDDLGYFPDGESEAESNGNPYEVGRVGRDLKGSTTMSSAALQQSFGSTRSPSHKRFGYAECSKSNHDAMNSELLERSVNSECQHAQFSPSNDHTKMVALRESSTLPHISICPPTIENDPTHPLSCSTFTSVKGSLGLLGGTLDAESTFSLSSACSTESQHDDCRYLGPEASQVRIYSGFAGIGVSESDKENQFGRGGRSAAPIDPAKAGLQGSNAQHNIRSPVLLCETKDLLPEYCVSPLNLSATASLDSPPCRFPPFSISTTTDEIFPKETDGHTAYAWHVEMVAGEGLQTPRPQISGRDQKKSPPDVPSPQSVIPINTRPSSSAQFPGKQSEQNWSPLDEPRFIFFASKMLNDHPEDFRQILLREGITREMWELLGLPENSRLPSGRTPLKFSEADVQHLFSIITKSTNALEISPTSALRLSQSQQEFFEEIYCRLPPPRASNWAAPLKSPNDLLLSTFLRKHSREMTTDSSMTCSRESFAGVFDSTPESNNPKTATDEMQSASNRTSDESGETSLDSSGLTSLAVHVDDNSHVDGNTAKKTSKSVDLSPEIICCSGIERFSRIAAPCPPGTVRPKLCECDHGLFNTIREGDICCKTCPLRFQQIQPIKAIRSAQDRSSSRDQSSHQSNITRSTSDRESPSPSAQAVSLLSFI